MDFVCGPVNAEDLVWLGEDGTLIASGMADASGRGALYAIDANARTYVQIYPAESAANRFDKTQFPDCPGEPVAESFSTHGLAIRAGENGRFRLLATGHGAREAVEVFDVTPGPTPQVTWIGCVTIPQGNSINSVVTLPDGGFLTTRIFGELEKEKQAIFAGELGGFIYEWHPGGTLQKVPGTEMSAPNGIDISADGNQVYVASWGRGEVTRFTRAGIAQLKREDTVDIGGRVDNVRFTSDGTLLLAAHRLAPEQNCGDPLCFVDWTIMALDPKTLQVTTLAVHEPRPDFLAATVAVRGNGGLWLGTFHGSRVAFIPEPPE